MFGKGMRSQTVFGVGCSYIYCKQAGRINTRLSNTPLIVFKALSSCLMEYSTAFWKALFSLRMIMHLLGFLFPPTIIPPLHLPPVAEGKIAPLNLHAPGIDRLKASKSHYTRLYCYCIDNNTLSEQLTHSHNYAEITAAV